MHNTFLKKLLIILVIALPTLSSAVDTPPAGDLDVAASEQTTVITPPPATVTEEKPAEAAIARQPAKIGYVDIARIGVESDRGKGIKTLLTAKKEQLQGRIDSRKKQVEKLKSSIEAKIPTMTPQQREAKSKEFQKKLEEFQKFVRTSEEELQTLQGKETRTLYEDIARFVDAYGKANDFSAIVIKNELLYVGRSVDAQDITEALMKALNETVQKK